MHIIYDPKQNYNKTRVGLYKDLIYFDFSYLPPSENHAMLQKGWKKYPSAELKKWRKHVDKVCPEPIILAFDHDDPFPWLQIEIRVYMHDLFNKSNKLVKRFDVHNRIKYLVDGIEKKLVFSNGRPFDDKYFKRITATKIEYDPKIYPKDNLAGGAKLTKKNLRFCQAIVTAFGGGDRDEYRYLNAPMRNPRKDIVSPFFQFQRITALRGKRDEVKKQQGELTRFFDKMNKDKAVKINGRHALIYH